MEKGKFDTFPDDIRAIDPVTREDRIDAILAILRENVTQTIRIARSKSSSEVNWTLCDTFHGDIHYFLVGLCHVGKTINDILSGLPNERGNSRTCEALDEIIPVLTDELSSRFDEVYLMYSIVNASNGMQQVSEEVPPGGLYVKSSAFYAKAPIKFRIKLWRTVAVGLPVATTAVRRPVHDLIDAD
jgi:hypothetical protein